MENMLNKSKDNSEFELVVFDKTNGTENKHTLNEGKEIIIGEANSGIQVKDEMLGNNRFSITATKDAVKANHVNSSNGIQFITKPVQVFENQIIFKGKSFIFWFQKKED